MFQGWTFSRAIHHTLLHYRATQHSTTVVSPAFLMLGCELHLPLDRLSPALPKGPLPRVRASATRQQRRMKQKFDLSARIKVPDIKAADWVRVHRPHTDNKLASYLSAPLQAGPSTFLLSNGTRWQASRLRKVPLPAHTTSVTPEATPSAWQDTPELQLTPQIAPAQAPDMPITCQLRFVPAHHRLPSLIPLFLHGLSAFVLAQGTSRTLCQHFMLETP